VRASAWPGNGPRRGSELGLGVGLSLASAWGLSLASVWVWAWPGRGLGVGVIVAGVVGESGGRGGQGRVKCPPCHEI
jgi:hypothetical protein